MSNIKSKYWNFVCSEDYLSYYIEGSPQDQQERIKTMQERFSTASQYQGTSKLSKRIEQVYFKVSKNA